MPCGCFNSKGTATTIEQIAEAAEISPSTFFRYFATKEDVALWDDLDPQLIALFKQQPAELSPIQALRNTVREVFAALPAEEVALQWERARLIISVPELRMRMLDQFTSLIDVFGELFAKRVGRRADDFAVRIFAGAVVGAMLAAMFSAGEGPYADYLARMDESLALLDTSLTLA